MQQKILITGGSGLLGKALTQLLLAQGYSVAWLSRTERTVKDVRIFLWDVEADWMDHAAIAWADVVIHLAGEGIADKRWTAKRKALIISSRSQSSALLLRHMQTIPNHITAVICASAIGWYGDNHSPRLSEKVLPGKGFLSASVQEWEKATSAFRVLPVRLVQLRIGIVLSTRGGALPELMQTAMFRILPVLSNGRQTYSWIHIHDVTGIIQFAIEHKISGVFNAVAPIPATQKHCMQTIARVKQKKYLLMPVPAFILKTFLGEMSDAVLVDQDIAADKIQEEGYVFHFPEIRNALTDIFMQKC